MRGFAVTERQSLALNRALNDLLVLSESNAVFMTDYGGNLIAYNTSDEVDDTVYTIAALAAGSFSATRELAGLIKEPEFHSIHHQGKNSSIYMQSVASDFLVLVIFGKETTAGLVKLYVEKAKKDIEPIVEEMCGQSTVSAAQGSQPFEMDKTAPVFKKMET